MDSPVASACSDYSSIAFEFLLKVKGTVIPINDSGSQEIFMKNYERMMEEEGAECREWNPFHLEYCLH